MKKHLFYFVRHGQSILNKKGIRQDSHGQLSDKGVEQAHVSGERLENEIKLFGKMDVILCSPYDRTRETAGIINEHIKVEKPIEYNDLLAERRNPSEIIGHSVDEPDVKKIVDIIDHSYHDDNFRYSDEENFSDLLERAKKCLAWLETRKEKRIVVVTHGIFLKMLIDYIEIGDKLNAKEYNRLSFLNPSSNAGITVCQYTNGFFAPRKGKRWQLIDWNDHVDVDSKSTSI